MKHRFELLTLADSLLDTVGSTGLGVDGKSTALIIDGLVRKRVKSSGHLYNPFAEFSSWLLMDVKWYPLPCQMLLA